ncbi:class I SAM-dependent methyltransferase [Oryzobacter terrae]|uniref:class I SAM-dependent methyltransferase n=1 Tax=Oryzobacter terrae TaxID=1620385 RepID=UPI00367019EE
MSTTRVDPTNEDQARAWDGPEGAFWATHHHQLEAVLGHYQPAFAEACAIGPDDDVLDVGCGTGETSRAAAAVAVRGTVTGLDLSSAMVRVGRSLAVAHGLTNVRLLCADAQVHPFVPESHDVVMSRTGAMFFGRPRQAFTNIARAMRPGARLALLTWQPPARNAWFSAFTQALLGAVPTPSSEAPGPFSMSDRAVVEDLLDGSGFRDVHIAGLTGPVTYGRDPDHAYALLIGLLGWMLETRAPDDRAAAAEALRTTLGLHHGSRGVQFDSATWLVTATRA